MNEGIKKFEQLMKTDADFQAKLQAAMAAYQGEQTEEAVFNNVLVPLGAEYGITATYDEFKAYVEGIGKNSGEMSADEMEQVAGGKVNGGGVGMVQCNAFGGGLGIVGGEHGGGLCVLIGAGTGDTMCLTAGHSQERY
jgi:hypothetical protein